MQCSQATEGTTTPRQQVHRTGTEDDPVRHSGISQQALLVWEKGLGGQTALRQAGGKGRVQTRKANQGEDKQQALLSVRNLVYLR